MNEAPPARPAAIPVLRLPDVRAAKRHDWAELVRFCVVGASGWVVNLAVFSLLVTLGAHYIPAAIGAFCVAWCSNFLLNKYWTFRRHGLSAVQQGARNLLVSLGSLGVSLAILHLLVQAGTPAIPAQAAAIVLPALPTFLLNRRWSFR